MSDPLIPTKPPGKSWREINQERKALKRQRNEEKIIKREKRLALEKEVEVKAQEEAEIEKKNAEISTISIAVPGSIMENAQSAELRTYLAGQIARAACIFCVDEVIVYDDIGDKLDTKKSKLEDTEGLKIARKSCVQLARILQYLECPQYLRKHFFPIHKDLEFAGLLNPLDAPHHLRMSNDFKFREGITMNKKVKPGRGSQVNVGLLQDVSSDKLINPGIRVTVKMLPAVEGSKKLKGKIVSLATPRAETGVYWGYTVRIATNLSQIFTQSPYKDGYDLTIGTSDRGTHIDELPNKGVKYNHALIVFGGLQGIEAALESDEQLKVDDASLLFNHYINVLPNQGSRTIRTEEAVLVALSSLRSKLKAENEPMVFKETGIATSSIFPQEKQDIPDHLGNENNIDLSRFD
ncbi:PREDICTED: putative methyltransferase C9orf114 isoform X1 [Papilio polytes]|uniref:putative methyltransferase C9orf114 isoform X1 n=2 Tax=Papilio polytes TaxID=76194 RepID=UPI000676025A|nr:PREDICTED: putative methyltransferase C9orf114 isoform X1 [Papilio polytes]